MIKHPALLVIILVLSLSSPALAAEPNGGKIEGQIVNGTAGSSSVADQDITLKIELDGNEAGSNTTKTDAEGYFTFDALSTEPGYSYQVALTFQRAEYTSQWLNFGEGETIKSTELVVYDSTTSDEAIAAIMTHTIIYVEEGSLLVKEYFSFVNMADRTYIGATPDESKSTLKFSLPQGTTDLQPTIGLMECCIVSTDGGFTDTMPVLPGIKEIAYSYRVGVTSATYTLSRLVDYPTANYDLLVQGGDTEVTGDRLTVEEPLDISGVQFKHLSRQDLAPGDTLTINLAGLSGGDNNRIALWGASALIVLALGFVLFSFERKRRRQLVSSEDSPDQRRQRLFVELAELDDDFEAGKIPEPDYQQMRAEKKAQLVKLMRSSAEEAANK